ncbi:MAG: NAD(P)-binding protein [Dehalococcoidia bacterium]|nr:NAD(P)-binding protein [Dehalococcoidia bacterium]
MNNGNKNVPAALVVGGGIAGMQAALDIANAGFKVYLVEREPSIGGHMSQFDKVFPTLDCAACVGTPKLVDVGNHPNIELMTYSEVTKVTGSQGNFKVQIRRKPRYVDWKKCTGCGTCSAGCPVVMTNRFDRGLSTRKATYVQFPQAVPNKYLIDKREERPCKAACQDACPVHTNVLGYIKQIAEGRFEDAYKTIRDTNPLPAVCGRICYAPCEKVCNRGQLDEPMAIRELKRAATDRVNIEKLEAPNIKKTGEKVAVIGGGPAGLAAANDLALKGHGVTIFESLPEPGGMLRYGIPEYRLSKETLRQEIGYITKLGVEIRTGVKVGKDISLEQLRKEHDAVFVGTGAQGGMTLGVAGEDQPGVMEGIKFLREMNLGEKVNVRKRVAVIGGGNTALDCARTARRSGAENVKIVYRRSRAEMPAAEEEVKAAEEEGIAIEILANPTRFISENGKLAKIECIRMKLGEPDAGGRPRPIPIQGSEFTIAVDTVITALGQALEVEFLKELGISLSKRGTIEVDPGTGATNVEGIFAGGDVVTGPAYVIDAIAAGKKAARSIDRYLQKEPLKPEETRKQPGKFSQEEIESSKKRFPLRKRLNINEEPAEERVKSFREVSPGYATDAAIQEASRCLAGQIEGCIECRSCERYCLAGAVDFAQKEETVEIEVGAIILATGFDTFDARLKPEFGYGRYPNVITSLELERLCSPSGPTKGKVLINGKEPHNVVFIQCFGSRDKVVGNRYCSRVCCMYTAKQAHYIKYRIHDAKVTVCYIDIRAFGKGYEEFYENVQKEEVIYRKSSVSEVYKKGDKLIVRAEDGLLGEMFEEEADLVVLAVGMVPQPDVLNMTGMLQISQSDDGFFQEVHAKLGPVETKTAGIFMAGCCQGPKDIPDSVTQASGAAGMVCALLSRMTRGNGAS